MPITPDKLKKQLDLINKHELMEQSHFKQGFRELEEFIDKNEIIEDICGVDTAKKNYLMVVTNKRLFFINSYLIGSKKTIQFNYRNLQSVEHKKGFLYYKIIIRTRDGRKYTFSSRTEGGIREITEKITEKVKYLL